MLPTEVGTFGKWLATSPLADHRIWRREVEKSAALSQAKLQVSGKFISQEDACELPMTMKASDYQQESGMSVRRLTNPQTGESLLLVEGCNGQYLTVS